MGHNSNYVKVEDTKNLFRVNNCQVRSVERTAVNEVGKELFTKSKFSSNHRFSKSKMKKEQNKILNFTRKYFSTSSVQTRGRELSAALDDAVKKDPDPGKVSARSNLKKKEDDDFNKNTDDKKKETDDDDEKNDVKQEEKEDAGTKAKEKKGDNFDDKEEAKEIPNSNSMRKFDEMKESRTKRKEVKLFRKFEIEI